MIYEELRRLAAQKLGRENPGQTLQATALVHDAYPRLVETEKIQHWDSRGHFFAAAAEAMRQILIDQARGKQRLKRGGGLRGQELGEVEVECGVAALDLIALDDALLEASVTFDTPAPEGGVTSR